MSLTGDYREVLSWKLSCTEVGLAYISKFKSVPLLIHDGLPGLTLALRVPLMGMALNANPKRAACNVDDHIIERIRKCWERWNHPTAAESEAKTALFLASRLMSQYNVNLAELLPKETPENRAQLAGSTNVSIRSTKGDDRRVVHQGFVSTLAQSMDIFFDCKSYSCRRNVGICWRFYGIAKNAVAAAQAFEMTHNKIVEWACAYSGTAASFSYCKGIADGLLSMAYKQKRQESEKARKQEEENLSFSDRRN